jgi:hypothetical protein
MKCLQGEILTSFAHFSYLLPDDSAGKIARELWVVDESGVFPSQHDLTKVLHAHYQLGDEEEAHWWLQFRDIVSPPST